MDIIVENPENVNSAEIIVGISSYNEADSIAFPTNLANHGLINYFPSKKSVIINVDKINAVYKNGVLEIHLPKKDEAKPKEIPIKIK